MHRTRRLPRRHPGFDAFILRVAAGVDPAVVASGPFCHQHDVILKSYANSCNVSGSWRHEWSLWLLVFMGFVVAAFGIVNTLTMNVLEQTRELGLLRIVAMTKKQVRRTIITQA
jgi:putative ABC transport system permease protein